MKNYIIIFTCCLLLSSCNKPVLTDISPISDQQPDFNLLAEASTTFLYFSKDTYNSEAAIYLRPYANVSPIDRVTLLLKSSQPGRFIFSTDTLYSGDKKDILYKDFSKYLYTFKYQTFITGNHNLEISATIRKTEKTASIKFKTLE